MHWAEVEAQKLLKDKKIHVLATGITPSGPIHIGNMREILTTDAVYRQLKKKDADAKFIYVADDFDPLRKVYPYLPKWYEDHVGKPISDIPCPCGEHKSYADHYLSAFLNCLDEIGVNPILYRANEMYKKGMYQESIRIALEKKDEIRRIIEEVSKRQLPKNWLPFNVRCQECGSMNDVQPLGYDYPIISYRCKCGYEGEADITVGGVGKLPWRVDWPARWKMLGVTFEPCGKDLATVGGARDTGRYIVEKIFNYPHPALVVYEFILLKGKGAMHSSKGTALSSDQMLQMTPPEVLRFLLMNNQPNKHITFDSGLGLLNLVDEYDRFERVFFGTQEEIKGMKDLEETYELSQPKEIPKKLPIQLPYRHLVTLAQIAESWPEMKSILIRTDQIPKGIGEDDEARLAQRAEHVRFWLDNFAPEMVRFSVQKKLPEIELSVENQIFLKSFSDSLNDMLWDAESIHNGIYQAAEDAQVSVKDGFSALYKIILGKSKGPRAGFFLSNLDKDFVRSRVSEALK